MEELKSIMEKFVASGWDLISIPAQQWLDGKADKDTLVSSFNITINSVSASMLNNKKINMRVW